MVLLESLADVVYEPWIDPVLLKKLGPEPLAARIREVGAGVVICETDVSTGEVLELPLRAIGSTRGAPSNVDVAAATKRGIPVLHTPRPQCGGSRGTHRRGVVRRDAQVDPRRPRLTRRASRKGWHRIPQHGACGVARSRCSHVCARRREALCGGARPFRWRTPAQRTRILQNPNTVLTPHIGGATYDTEAIFFSKGRRRPRKSLIGRNTALHRGSRGAGVGREEARRNELFGALGRASELAVCVAADNGSQLRGSCLK